MDIHTIATAVGIVGVIVVLLSYILLQLQHIDPYSFLYSCMNLMGSVMVLFSLYYEWNLSAVIIEVVWSFISLYGMYRALMKRFRS